MVFGSFLMMDNHTEIVSVLVKEFPEWSGYEIWDLVVSVLLVVITGILLYNIHNQVKAQRELLKVENEQVKIQNKQLKSTIKSYSAQFVRDFDTETYGKPDIAQNREYLRKDPKNMVFGNDVEALKIFLSHFEGLAIYWEDGVATHHHVSEWFSSDLLNMSQCPYIMNYLRYSANLDNPVYDRLYELINTIVDDKKKVGSTHI